MFLSYLLRFLLIWWIVTIAYRWLTKGAPPKKGPSGTVRDAGRDPLKDMPFADEIEDADFEEIDDQ